MSELIDRERFSADMRDFQNRVGIWRDEAEDTETRTRADAALATIIETKLILDKQPTIPAPRWHRVEDELPESNDAVNVVWANRNPESYYADIKDKPFVATAHYHKGKWYWFSATCKDFLDEYGRCEVDEVDKDIDILYWMPLPEPPLLTESSHNKFAQNAISSPL